jgi:AcrR family transcriptional regulator
MSELNSAQQAIFKAAMQLFAERGATHVNIKELAQAAGVARNTIYNNHVDPETLFDDVAANLAAEMNNRVVRSFDDVEDPALRLAIGVRLYVRRAHEEPTWGRFLARFGFGVVSLQEIWDGQPMRDLEDGVRRGRYAIQREQLASAVNFVAGSTLGAISLVLEGIKTWREAGSNAAEFALVGLGVARHEARALATQALPPLSPP